MTKEYQNDEAAEYEQCPVMNINREIIRTTWGDKVAERMSDEMVDSLADALGCSSRITTRFGMSGLKAKTWTSAGNSPSLGRTKMKLACKRCQHQWNYRGKKIATGDYPLYVTCPRCRTVVKLPVGSTDSLAN